jgi:hypothetical protein
MTRKSKHIKKALARAKALAVKGGRNGESEEGRHRSNGKPSHLPGSSISSHAALAREIELEEEDERVVEEEPERVIEEEDERVIEEEDSGGIELEPDADIEVEEQASADHHDTNGVIVEVSPASNRGTRLVVCRQDGVECHRHRFDTNNAEHRRKFIAAVAKTTGIDKDELAPELDRQLIEKADAADQVVESQRAEQQALAAEGVNTSAAQLSAKILAETPKETVRAAKRFLKSPGLFDELKQDIETLGVVGEFLLALAVYIIGTSRILLKPLGGLIQAASSTGKSYVSSIVVSLMPEEGVLKATDITGQALYYLSPGSLRHRFVVVAERKHQESQDDAAAANASLALREMFSSGELRKVVTIKGEGGMTAVEIRQEGPIAYLETTTQEQIFSEDETRLMKLTADESQEQTARVIEQLQREAAGDLGSADEREQIRLKYQTAQRLLQPLRVVVPYARHLSIPTTKVAARRAFGQLIGCIQAVALLRQFQKKISDDCIVADIEDYKVVYKIMLPVLRRAFAPVSQRATELLARIIERIDNRTSTFSRNDCAKWAGIGLTEVRNRLPPLLEAGCITYRLAPDAESQAVKLRELASPQRLVQLIADEDVEVE